MGEMAKLGVACMLKKHKNAICSHALSLVREC